MEDKERNDHSVFSVFRKLCWTVSHLEEALSKYLVSSLIHSIINAHEEQARRI